MCMLSMEKFILESMLINNIYGRFASFFKNHELKEADKYIKRVFPNAELYIDYEHALVFERIGEDKVFEEYIDVVHFALMYEIKFGSGCYQYEDIKWNYNKLKTDLGFGQAYAFSCVISLTRDDNVLAYVIALGLHLGYSFGEIYNEYIRKNEINKERLAKGY